MHTRKPANESMRGVRLAQHRSRETLQRILDAAIRVFEEKGYQRTTVSEIISRAGIGHGTFWIYFHNKDDLLRYMLQDMIGEFEAFDWYRSDDPVRMDARSLDNVKEIIGGVMDVFARHSKMHPLVMQASLVSEEFRDTLDEMNKPFLEIVEKKFREHLEKGWCRDLDPKIIARIIVGMLEYANVQLANAGPGADRERLVENLSTIIYHALNHPPTGSPPPTGSGLEF